MRRMILPLLLTAAAPAVAQSDAPRPGPPMRPGMLLRADADGDGAVTRAEATAAADRRFDRLDADRDGTVTPDEFRVAREAMRGRSGDGPPPPSDSVSPAPPRPLPLAMTRDQSRARALELFDRADANGDGTVDRTELAAMRGTDRQR